MRKLRGAVAGLALLILPLAASATPLDAIEGTSASIGGLTITFTKVEQVGGLDLGQIELVLVADGLGVGFDLLASGALSVANGALADLKLEFTVASTAGLDGVGNHLTATATGLVSSASVSELILEAPGIDVGVVVTALGSLASNEQAFGETLHHLTITEITRLQQRFSVVPEPTTGLLVLLGLAGLAGGGRRR